MTHQFVIVVCVLSVVWYDLIVFIVFFFKQKTAYEMRISDWSSDVCSSDLGEDAVPAAGKASTFAGANFLCTIEPERSRITVSSTNDVPVDFARGGCVNARTQYTKGADGRWQRILVPQEEATVTIASIDPETQLGRAHV